MNLSKNIKAYKIYMLFSQFIIIGPVIMFYLYAKGLSFTQIMMLNSISAVCVFLFEVPTGAIADKLSRKASLALGSAFWSLSLTIYIFAPNFFVCAVAEVLFALGLTFKSGSNNAYLFDLLKVHGKEDQYSEITGASNAYMYYGQAVGSIISGFVYAQNIHLPMIISVIASTIAVFIALSFDEPSYHTETEKESYLKHVIESGKYAITHPRIKAIMFYGMTFYTFFRLGFFLYQPYMNAIGLNVQTIGIFFAFFNIIAGFTSKRIQKVIKFTKGRTLMFLSGLLVSSFLLMGMTTMWFGACFIFLQQMARGIYRPVVTKYMNKHIPSEKRATILSFYSLVVSLVAAGFYPLFGKLVDATDPFVSNYVLFFVMIVANGLALVYYGRTQKKDLDQLRHF